MNQKELKPAKPVTDGRVICNCCKEFSGWTNDDLVFVKPGRKLKCKNCQKVCVVVMDKSDMEIVYEEREFDRENEIFIERNILC